MCPIQNAGPNQRFQSTLPLRGATVTSGFWSAFVDYFNPRSPYGERHTVLIMLYSGWNFNPRSPYGERLLCLFRHNREPYISIHAPLTGSDTEPQIRRLKLRISIHAPLTGSDVFGLSSIQATDKFQSTLPLRGATGGDPGGISGVGDFNPRSPYGERLSNGAKYKSR